jgi:hypothetical protein
MIMNNLKVTKAMRCSMISLAVAALLSGSVSAQPQAEQGLEHLLSQAIVNFDKESFLIGTLDDYMGREHRLTCNILSDTAILSLPDEEKRVIAKGVGNAYQKVDAYRQGERVVALLIDSLFRSEYPDLAIVDESEGTTTLYSAALRRTISGYYSYKPRGYVFGDTLYLGYIRRDRLKTEAQKISFLAGVFLRDGLKTVKVSQFLQDEKNESRRLSGVDSAADIYCLSLPNSTSKAWVCEMLLVEMGCKYVDYVVKSSNIPVSHQVRFISSEKVLPVIDFISKMSRFSADMVDLRATAPPRKVFEVSAEGSNTQ